MAAEFKIKEGKIKIKIIIGRKIVSNFKEKNAWECKNSSQLETADTRNIILYAKPWTTAIIPMDWSVQDFKLAKTTSKDLFLN